VIDNTVFLLEIVLLVWLSLQAIKIDNQDDDK
jgi:hypothetical protein